MSTDILHSFSCTPYRVSLCHLTGNIQSALIMQQMEYWFRIQGKRFYKFLGIPKKPHPQYRVNDSWTEELGISEKVFRRAFDKIGVRHSSKTAYKSSENPFINAEGKEQFFCSYYDKPSHLTYYFRNNSFLNKTLCRLVDDEQQVHKAKQTARAALHHTGQLDVVFPELEALISLPDGSLPSVPTEEPVVIKTPVVAVEPKAEEIIEAAETPKSDSAISHAVLSRNDVHFKGLNGDEITSMQKILKVIEPDKQLEVLQVLQKNSKQGKVKNKVGYLHALVKSVLAKGFSPLKPKAVKLSPAAVLAKAADEETYSVAEYVKTLQAKYHKKPSKQKAVQNKSFFNDWKQGLNFR